MVDRIRFKGITVRKFLDLVIEKTNSPSLRGLIQFGLDAKYSALKNYYQGSRLIPQDLFEELLELSRLDKKDFEFEILGENWGKIKGGKKSRRGKA